MAKPLVVTISHELGREEAKRRIARGLDLLQSRYGGSLLMMQNSWTGDRLSFEVGAFGQRASGTVDVGEAQATLTVTLPLLLAMMAEKARSLIQKEGRLLLEKK